MLHLCYKRDGGLQMALYAKKEQLSVNLIGLVY